MAILALLAISGATLLVVSIFADGLRTGPAPVLAATGLALLALLLRFLPGRFAAAALAVGAFAVSLRYLVWRTTETLHFSTTLEAVLGGALLAAEVFLFLLATLTALRMISPATMRPAALPLDVDAWPKTDVFIPAGEAPLDAVRDAALAAVGLDYPPSRFDVHIVAAPGRQDIAAFAAEAGIGLISADGPDPLRQACAATHGELIAVFQPDHPPTRAFLQLTAGVFLRREDVAFVQTPFAAYPTDLPGGFALAPIDDFAVLADGDFLWNATRIHASGVVIRRAALDDIDGLARQDVDALGATGLRLLKAGWSAGYLKAALSAGPADATAATPWRAAAERAWTTIGLVRSEAPILGRGLRLGQRISWLARLMDCLRGLPLIVLLAASAAYLVLGVSVIATDGMSLLAYGLPHLAFAAAAAARLRGVGFWRRRLDDAAAMRNFPIAAKAMVGEAARPTGARDPSVLLILLAIFIGLGVAVGLMRLAAPNLVAALPEVAGRGLTLVFLVWAVVALVGVIAMIVAVRRPALACSKRQGAVQIPATLVFADGEQISAVASAVSMSGARFSNGGGGRDRAGETVLASFDLGSETVTVDGVMAPSADGGLVARFERNDLAGRAGRVRLCFSRADAWLDAVGAGADPGRPSTKGSDGMGPKPGRIGSRAAALIGALLLSTAVATAPEDAAAESHASGGNGMARVPLSAFTAARAIELPAPRGVISLAAPLPADRQVTQGRLVLQVAPMDVDLGPEAKITAYLNDALIGSAPLTALGAGAALDFKIAGDLFDVQNVLRLEAAFGDAAACGVAGLRIDASASRLELMLKRGVAADDLALLPRPFADPAQVERRRIRFVLPADPSERMLEAAAIVASYFGASAGKAGVVIDVAYGLDGPGDVVVFAAGDRIPSNVVGLAADSSQIYLLANPMGDETHKALVLTGADDDGLLAAARWLAIGASTGGLQTSTISVTGAPTLESRRPDDASRWVRLDRLITFGELVDGPNHLQGHGVLGRLGVGFKTPPRSFENARQGPILKLAYDAPMEQVDADHASVAVLVAGAYAKTFKMAGAGNEVATAVGGARAGSVVVRLDPATFSGHANQLGFAFRNPPASDACGASSTDARFRIRPTSSLDFRAADPGTLLPELKHFASAAYPFTRMADFSETVAVLPAKPATSDVAAFLSVMAHAGQSTGDAALKITVSWPDGLGAHGDKDVLAVGGWQGLAPLWAEWVEAGPFSFRDGQMHVAAPAAVSRLDAYLSGAANPSETRVAARMQLDAAGPGFAGATSFERPGAPGRTVVLLAGSDGDGGDDVAMLISRLSDPALAAGFRGDLVRWSPGDGFKGFALGETYRLQSGEGWRRVLASYADGPLAQIALLIAAVALLAAALFLILQRIAAARAFDLDAG